jgi:hypothetical protein
MVCRDEDLVPRLESEGFDAHEQTLASKRENAATGILQRKREPLRRPASIYVER